MDAASGSAPSDADHFIYALRDHSRSWTDAYVIDDYGEQHQLPGPMETLADVLRRSVRDQSEYYIRINGEREFQFTCHVDYEGGLGLRFGDGSSIGDIEEFMPDSDALDGDLRLLEPLSLGEIASIEPLLGVLWVALDSDQLSEVHKEQILAMAKLIKAEQHAAVPGETPRWKLVGAVGSALRYLAKDVPKDALAWWKIVELLNEIDWTTVAGELPGI